MDAVALLVVVVLTVEIPLALRAARRVRQRYREYRAANLRQSRVFGFLVWLSLGVAVVGGLGIGLVVIYALVRAYGPPGVVDLGRGVIAVLVGGALVALLALPIAVDMLLTRIATDPTRDDEQQEVDSGKA